MTSHTTPTDSTGSPRRLDREARETYLAEPHVATVSVAGADGLGADRQAGKWGSILPAVWSFALAARLHGLGTVWTTGTMPVERGVAELLGIPFESVMQAALIPVAYTVGTHFRAARACPSTRCSLPEPPPRRPAGGRRVP